MAQVTQQQAEEAAKRDIVPGAVIQCAVLSGDTATVPPITEWELWNDGGMGFKKNGVVMNRIYICTGSRWATVITPAPSKEEGLKNGHACDPDELMRAAILAKAMELGLVKRPEDYPDDLIGYFETCDVLQNCSPSTPNITTIPAGEFYDRLCRTPAKPKPFTVNGHKVWTTKGTVEIDGTVYSNATIREIASKLID